MLLAEQVAIRRRPRARADLPRRPRRHVHGRGPRLPGPLGQGRRPRHHPRPEAPRTAVPPGAIPSRLSVLLAGRRRPADPVSAQELVHPHDAVPREDAGQQPAIHWLPEHIRDGRFGNFLETQRRLGPLARALLGHAAADLGLRGDRLHGGRRLLRGAAGQAGRRGLRGLGGGQAGNPDLPDHLKIHKPYIDAVTYDSPKAPGKRMRRVGDVIDCWFDSGAMPFAQWGYPHQPGSRAAFPRPVSRPTSSARPSTRPAAGSIACWRSARCCSARRKVTTRSPADRARSRSQRSPCPIRIPSATASCWG